MELLAVAVCVVPITSGVSRTNRMYDLRLGLETLRCEVVEVSRDEAIILMVDSNAQRSVILPCDKGRAYKMKLEAIKRQGQRTDLTSDPVGPKFERSNTELAEESGDSTTQIKRYIRLAISLLSPLKVISAFPSIVRAVWLCKRSSTFCVIPVQKAPYLRTRFQRVNRKFAEYSC